MKLRTALFLAMSLAAATPLYADDVKDTLEERAEARSGMARDAAQQHYEVAKENCKRMSGDAKDACLEQAKADFKKAKAQAEANEKGGKAQAEATEEQMKADYEAARERCDQLSGNAKDSCVADAKLKYRQ
jgi:hypothetical protein